MKLDKKSMRLYVVTDRQWLGGRDFYAQVESVLQSGATFLQLREKDMPYDAFLQEAIYLQPVAARYNIPFVINDNIEIALASNADGVHVGQSDCAVQMARQMLGPGKIIGVSAQTVQQACQAEADGADYIGVGAVFGTSTKPDANSVSFETLKAICAAVSIPVVAIGGINEGNILKLSGSGVDGAAVISAIFAKPDPAAAAKAMRALADRMVEQS